MFEVCLMSCSSNERIFGFTRSETGNAGSVIMITLKDTDIFMVTWVWIKTVLILHDSISESDITNSDVNGKISERR